MSAPRLLPLLAVAIGGVLALKAVSGLEGAPAFLQKAAAFAEEAAPGEGAPAPAKKPAKTGEAKTGEAKAPAAELASAAVAAADVAEPAGLAVSPRPAVRVCAPSATELAKEAGLSPAELRVLQSLQTRRGELDQRAQAMDTQLAVLNAAEAKLDAKLRSLTALRRELQGLLGQANEKEDAEVMRMVAVYQAMKPQDAAKVMTQLDDRVRVPVAAKMKERALAAILAKMPPLEAKKLTEKLALRFAAAADVAQKAKSAAAAPAPARPPAGKPAAKAG